jgi:hypothetical protein
VLFCPKLLNSVTLLANNPAKFDCFVCSSFFDSAFTLRSSLSLPLYRFLFFFFLLLLDPSYGWKKKKVNHLLEFPAGFMAKTSYPTPFFAGCMASRWVCFFRDCVRGRKKDKKHQESQSMYICPFCDIYYYYYFCTSNIEFESLRSPLRVSSS